MLFLYVRWCPSIHHFVHRLVQLFVLVGHCWCDCVIAACVTRMSCSDCIEASMTIAFQCQWCPSVGRCSDGLDRRRQEWQEQSCDKNVSSFYICSFFGHISCILLSLRCHLLLGSSVCLSFLHDFLSSASLLASWHLFFSVHCSRSSIHVFLDLPHALSFLQTSLPTAAKHLNHWTLQKLSSPMYASLCLTVLFQPDLIH